MRKWCSFMSLLAALAAGQSDTHARRLASAVSMSGAVIDRSGRALVGVDIHAGRFSSEVVRADREGRFTIRTDAPFIVFRKPGFESQRIRSVNTIAQMPVTLSPASRQLPVCLASTECAGLPHGAFCFPKTQGVWVSNPFSGGDGVTRDFWPYRNREVYLRHDCCGYVSSDGLPLLGKVWDSVEYQETIYAVAGLVILDARGKTSSGRSWRFLGRAGEYASYRSYDALLDKVIDGVCIQIVHRRAAE
jgi:hypothetical protein